MVAQKFLLMVLLLTGLLAACIGQSPALTVTPSSGVKVEVEGGMLAWEKAGLSLTRK